MKRAVLAVLVVVAMVATLGTSVVLSIRGGGAEPSAEPTPARVPELPPATSGEPAPSVTEPPRPALAPYYSQELDWSPCRDEFECTSVEVPLDYDEPRGETIELAVLRAPARVPEQRVGSLLVNPGGPGAPGTTYAQNAALAFGAPVRDNFDIVGWDPRGTGTSAPVDCLSDQELDAYLAGDPSPDTAAEIQEAVRWNARLGKGCVRLSPGELAAHVSTVETARDLDVLRAVLGEEELRYFGASYGTQIGATYAELFGERVGYMVLDGAIDPTLSSREQSLQQAAGFETALRAYVKNCLESSGCFLGETVEEGLRTIREFMESVDEQPLQTNTDRKLRVGNAFYGIVAPLYNRDYWAYLSTALRAGLNGNGSLLLALSDLYNSRGPEGYQNNSSEAIYAINCLDDPWAINAGQVSSYLDEFTEASPTFGEVFAWGLTGCSGLQVEPSVPELEIDGAGAAPILVIGTTRDPATPIQWAEAMAGTLESGILVRREGDGHTGYNAGNACVDDVVHDYLLDGDVPDGDLTCTADGEREPASRS